METLIKTKEDIAILVEGGRRHAKIVELLIQKVKPGIRTDELDQLAAAEISKIGDSASFLGYRPRGVKKAYPASICVSVNDEIVHGIPTENPYTFKEGDLVSIDLGLTHRGMITDMAVTIPVGKTTKENMNLIYATRESLFAGINEAREGNHVGDIGHAIESVAKKKGFKVVEGLAGHGVGYAVHEDPFIPNEGIPGEGMKLVAGMVLAIEPMLTTGNGRIVLERDQYTFRTEDGAPSTHCERTVLVTKGDPIILTDITLD